MPTVSPPPEVTVAEATARPPQAPRRRARDVALVARLLHRAARYRWKLNRAQIAAMLDLLPRGGVGLDIGAHKGAYSCLMARRVGSTGRVLAFEPQDRLVEDTWRALRTAGYRQVRFLHCAVSDRTGEGSIAVRRTSTHGASMEGLEGDDVFHQALAVLTVDDAVEREGLPRVDFIKIDVEGHEQSVLRGAQGTLRRFRPAVLVEIEARHHGTGADPGLAPPDPVGAVRAMLEPLGYRGEFFGPGGRRSIAEFSYEQHQSYGRGKYCNDFLFTAPGA